MENEGGASSVVNPIGFTPGCGKNRRASPLVHGQETSDVLELWSVLVQHARVRVGNLPGRPSDGAEVVAALTCGGCGFVTVGRGWVRDESHPELEIRSRTYDPKYLVEELDVEWEWPLRHPRGIPDRVPTVIAKAAREAMIAEAYGAPLAALLMARVAIEAAAKHHGITRPNLRLKERIDKLVEGNLLSTETGELAHQIRDVGNGAAHGELEVLSDPDLEGEAESTLDLMDFVLTALYTHPGELAELQTLKLMRTGAQS